MQKNSMIPALKRMLRVELTKQNVTQAELARRMGIGRTDVSRIVCMDHATKIDTLAKAFKAVGKTLTFKVTRV
jgi:antitoxin HicB